MYTTKEAVLQDKILSRIQNNIPKIEDVISKIQRDGNNLNDLLIPSKRIKFSANGSVYADYNGTNNAFTDFSLSQMADKVNIPVKYINSLAGTDWGRQLTAYILNEHVQKGEPQNLLIREVDGNIRGVLSDRYKRMNSLQIFMSFFNAAMSAGAKLFDGLHTDSKNFLEVVHPDLIPVETPNNGVVNLVMGARIRNSDFGDGALTLNVFILNAICLNGMVGEQLLREIHLGARINGIQQYLSFDTISKETEAQAAIIGDTMKSIFSGETREKEINRIVNASSKIIDLNNEIKQLPKLGVQQEEIKNLTNKLMANNPDDGVQGKNSLWKLVQGLTSVANEQPPARTRELQEIASQLY